MPGSAPAIKSIKTNWICLVLIYSVGIYAETSVLETLLAITGKWPKFTDREWYGKSSHMEKMVEFRHTLLRCDWPKGLRVFCREHVWLSPAWTERRKGRTWMVKGLAKVLTSWKNCFKNSDLVCLQRLWCNPCCLPTHCSAAYHKEDGTSIKSQILWEVGLHPEL